MGNGIAREVSRWEGKSFESCIVGSAVTGKLGIKSILSDSRGVKQLNTKLSIKIGKSAGIEGMYSVKGAMNSKGASNVKIDGSTWKVIHGVKVVTRCSLGLNVVSVSMCGWSWAYLVCRKCTIGDNIGVTGMNGVTIGIVLGAKVFGPYWCCNVVFGSVSSICAIVIGAAVGGISINRLGGIKSIKVFGLGMGNGWGVVSGSIGCSVLDIHYVNPSISNNLLGRNCINLGMVEVVLHVWGWMSACRLVSGRVGMIVGINQLNTIVSNWCRLGCEGWHQLNTWISNGILVVSYELGGYQLSTLTSNGLVIDLGRCSWVGLDTGSRSSNVSSIRLGQSMVAWSLVSQGL